MATVAALALAGCSEDEPSPRPDAAGASDTEGSTDAAEPTDGSTATSGPDVTGTVPDVEEPVASRTVTQDGNTYRLDVFPLVFEEGSPAVSVNVRMVFEKVTGTVTSGLLASQEDQRSIRARRASGIQVIDRKGGTAYLPARDAEDRPLCSPEVPGTANNGDLVYITCVFGGLDDEVEALDLVVPTFGAFRDVRAE